MNSAKGKTDEAEYDYEKSGDGESGTPEDQDGVVIPEEFQKQVSSVMDKATTKHHMSHIRSRLNDKEDEMRKKEDEERMKKVKGKAKEFSTADMPSSY